MEISVPSFLLLLNHSLVFPLPLSEKGEARMEDVIFISNVVFEDRCKHYVTNTLLTINKGEKKGAVQRCYVFSSDYIKPLLISVHCYMDYLELPYSNSLNQICYYIGV